MIVVKDQSELEHLRTEVEQLEQRASLGEFTAIFAHEVRNPINNISTGLELMQLNLTADSPHRDTIERMQQDCDRLAELMKAVLSYSRPSELALETLHLPMLAQRLIDRQALRMAKAGVQCSLQAQPDCPPVTGDFSKLEQALNNLIGNALNAMSESGGKMTIRIQPVKSSRKDGQEFVEVSISDTGLGIPVEIQDRIFQPFFTTSPRGTGLGLAITKRIITAHKGTIRVNSVPGGTVFTIRLPAAEAD